MKEFTFEAGQKRGLIGAILLGVICLIATFFNDDALHTRFWTNFLHNTVFFTGISFLSLFVYAAFTTAYAGWFVNFKRVWEAYSQFLIVGLGLLLVIIAGLWMHWHHLYHWAVDGIATEGTENYDKIIHGKAGFLNKNWFTFGTIIVVGIWYFFAKKLRALSIMEDDGSQNYEHYRTTKKYAAILLFFGAFSSAAMLWQWVMSIDAHWYSTMFAWYSTASLFVSALALTIITLIYLQSKGYYQSVTGDHFHDLGKFLFGFSIFWTYLWFDQYMLIWYSNNGEETVYFQVRRDQYPVLFYGNLVINFVLPFLILIRNSVKRKKGIMMAMAIILLFGHWLDFFLMIKPGALHTAQEALSGVAEHPLDAAHQSTFQMGFTIPGFLEIGTFIGFLGLFLYVAFHHLSKAGLEPKNDPYIEESLHHEVI